MVILSNGTPEQCAAALERLQRVYSLANTYIFVTDLDGLLAALHTLARAIFMFFNVQQIEEVSCQVLNYRHSTTKRNPVELRRIAEVYFYFDRLVLGLGPFSSAVNIAHDVIHHAQFMCGRVAGLYWDDVHLQGEKVRLSACLTRNFPHLERVDLATMH